MIALKNFIKFKLNLILTFTLIKPIAMFLLDCNSQIAKLIPLLENRQLLLV